MSKRIISRTARLKVKLAGCLTGNCGKVIEPVSLTYQQKRKKKQRKDMLQPETVRKLK